MCDDAIEAMRRFCKLRASERKLLLEQNEALYNAFESLELPPEEPHVELDVKRKEPAGNAIFFDVYERAKLLAEQHSLSKKEEVKEKQPMLYCYGTAEQQYARIQELAAAHIHDASVSLISFVRIVEQFKMWRTAARQAVSANTPGLSVKEVDNILNSGFRGPYSFHYLRTATAMLDLVATYPRLLHTALTQTDLIKFGAAFRKQCGLEADFWTRTTKEDRVFNIILETANKCKCQGMEVPFTNEQEMLVPYFYLRGGIGSLSKSYPMFQSFDMTRLENECLDLVMCEPLNHDPEEDEIDSPDLQWINMNLVHSGLGCWYIRDEKQLRHTFIVFNAVFNLYCANT